MSTIVDIINRALQQIGTRTTITQSNLDNNDCNEAIQANLCYENNRDDLLRMAPWDCGVRCAPLTYITSLPGTPENTSAATSQWQAGQPMPPWLYEYQHPVDCLRPCFVVPQLDNSFGSVPIYPSNTSTGSWPSNWYGPPTKYKVATDRFYPVVLATVVAGGSGYAVGDVITLEGTVSGDAPIGAPVQLTVASLSGSAVATVTVVNVVNGQSPAYGGSYFSQQTNPVSQGSTTGNGTGATFNLTYGSQDDQRVILTNQSNALLVYVRQVTNPNVMDTLFQSAWINIIASSLAMALTGDKALANGLIQKANAAITSARVSNANEGLTTIDMLPDWLRVRGIDYPYPGLAPATGYDWGPMWPTY